ncbi:hypothetical protein HPY31_14410 [Brevibacillus sp. HB1.3]|uniref:hypothetical protein n=1 Tax=Brevibacillus sp. HB1.3 TaxID=2738842 RepID=UPI001556716A|nr:hypothetical protein [Brevibacillus sp. HB1.3]NQF15107.1 hypothetical protein [Brevibacillus sp. HB1.3]
MSNSQFKDWIKLTTIIAEIDQEVPEMECPNCHQLKIDYQYVGDLKSRAGFLDIWCNSCLHGIHLSRTKAPENVSLLSFDAAEEYKKKVPNFTPIEP